MASEDTVYYIESNDMPLMGHLLECSQCGRKIHVGMVLIGQPHHTGIQATCGECLSLEDVEKNHPKIAAKMKKWLKRD
jgi:hypothetical protein